MRLTTKLCAAVLLILILNQPFELARADNGGRRVSLAEAGSITSQLIRPRETPLGTSTLYLPFISKQWSPNSAARRVNAPYLPSSSVTGERFSEMAIFWFGRVTPTENYADVRVGYNDSALYVYVAVIDRLLWQDTSPSAGDLTAWDAVTLLLSTSDQPGSRPGPNDYRFVAQFGACGSSCSQYQTAYRGNGAGWSPAGPSFNAYTTYRGTGGPNTIFENKGWAATFVIPFSSLGLSSRPADATLWRMAMQVHDRDDAIGTAIPDKVWPESMDRDYPAGWAHLAFGLPVYTPPPSTSPQTVTIRHKLNGATVIDRNVGGYTTCGGDPALYWTQWGETVVTDFGDFSVQNQSDIADWPCFSKYYVIFPLDALAPGKVIRAATLTLHQWSNSDPSQAQPSLIQILTVAEDWDDATLTWNNAPLALENVSQAWVNPRQLAPGEPLFPGLAKTWDVSRALAQAYAQGQPLRLAVYSADGAYHSGKYFISSDTGDWNAVGRPQLDVTWGNP